MPRLHKYVSRDAHYVLTSIDGQVNTYQLTPAGEGKLAAAGIVAGEHFERAILLDLYRTGDAFSRGGEFPEAVLANQPGPARDIVALNAGAALYLCGFCADLREGYARAGELIASGAARERFLHCTAYSQAQETPPA